MSYVYNLTDVNYKTNVFYTSTSWTIPQGANTISILAIGAGGGGAGGVANTSVNARTGGGGGGSGAITRITIPVICITDTLVIDIGVGGVGGTSGGGTGGNGEPTYVDMQGPNNRAIQTFLLVASGGTGGSTVSGGPGGVIATVSDSIYSQLGLWFALGGQSGSVGSVTNATGLTYAATGLPISGGGGGGGMAANATTASTGSDIVGTTSAFVPTNPGGVGNTSLTNGRLGPFSITPFYSLGGSGGGGGGTTPISGGNGGNGSPGCGGGGGGAGTSPTGVGGIGGNGGNGLVIIQYW